MVLMPSVLTSSASADVLNDLGTGLAFAGFDVRGNRNPLSGGTDLLITNTFTGSPLDFGVADISFQGPVSLQVSTARRVIPQFDVSLTTAVDNRSQPTPLNYVFNYNAGGQSAQISGSTLVNAHFSIDGLGFYKLSLDSSSRQTVNRNDQSVADQTHNDSDFGPISVSGNIFTDALALVTDPLFKQAGRSNPFASSPAAKLIEADPAQRQELLKALMLSGEGVNGPAFASGNATGFGFPASAAVGLSSALANQHGRSIELVVPEPPVLALLLLGIPAIVGRFGLRKQP